MQVDLVTGGFTLTPGAPRAICNDADVQRPVTKGQLDKAQLATLRAAYAAVQKGGLTQCGSGKTSDRIVVDNGGPAILVLTDGAKTVAAPDELSCWTAAARELGLTLDRTLGSRAGRGAPETP